MAGDTVNLTDIIARASCPWSWTRPSLCAARSRHSWRVGQPSSRSAGYFKNVRRATATRFSSASTTKR